MTAIIITCFIVIKWKHCIRCSNMFTLYYLTNGCARQYSRKINSSDCRVVRAPAAGALDLGLIPSRVQPMTLKLVFLALKGNCEKQTGKFTSSTVGIGN